MASNLPLDLRLQSTSSDGRWLLTQSGYNPLLINLTNGRTKDYTLPQEAVIAR